MESAEDPIRSGADVQAAALARADAAFARLSGEPPEGRLFVPGRIEVLGKHTDYAGGRSITCAIERGFSFVFRRRRDARLVMVDARLDRRLECVLGPDAEPQPGHWSNYVLTVVRRLSRNFAGLSTGADVAFASTLPTAAGLSTSSALIIGTYLLLARLNALPDRPEYRGALGDPLRLAAYLGCVENGRAFGALAGDQGVGTRGGSEDHTAILLSEADRLGCYRYHPEIVRLTSLPLPSDLTFVVAASGIAAAKTGGAQARYNRAATLVTELVRRWNASTGRSDETLAQAIDSSPEAVGRLREMAAGDEGPRLEHFLIEDREILPRALEALASGDLAAFGRLADRSQASAEALLGNQVPETIALARLARALGAHAASSFGAGFGGSVWALVDAERADAFRSEWAARYAAEYPEASARSEFFTTRPGTGARFE